MNKNVYSYLYSKNKKVGLINTDKTDYHELSINYKWAIS